jgi:hypothetical protein
MADYASVTRLIGAALAPKANEQANWVTTQEATEIVNEARQAQDPRADNEVATLFAQGRPKDPQVYRGNGPWWNRNAWSSFDIERGAPRGLPPDGTVWMDAPESERFAGDRKQFAGDPTQALGVLNSYIVDNNIAGSKNIGSLWFGSTKQAVNGRTFLLRPGQSLSFQVANDSHRRYGSIEFSPTGLEVGRGYTLAYTPGDRRPICGASLRVPTNAVAGTQYTVKTAGISFVIQVA